MNDGDLHVRRLASAADALPFAPLTFPTFHRTLFALGHESGPVMLGASRRGEPVGLALAIVKSDTAQLLSLAVATHARGTGIGGKLMVELESILRGEGVARMELNFTDPNATSEAWRRLLRRAGWSEPTPRMRLFTLGRGSLETVARARWMSRQEPPVDCALFPWTDLTSAEEGELRAEVGPDSWFPPVLSPFAMADPIDARLSVGLRYQGRVAGWLIAHRIAEGTVRYTSLFVRQVSGLRGAGLVLLAESIRRQLSDPGRDVAATFGIEIQNPLLAFAERRLIPHVEVVALRTSFTSGKWIEPGHAS